MATWRKYTVLPAQVRNLLRSPRARKNTHRSVCVLEAVIIAVMLPSRRVTVGVPIKTRITGILLMVVMIAMFVGFVIFETWPARPRDWVGWALALLVGVPVLLLGEYAGEALTKRAPADPGRRVSIKRIAWMLAAVLGFGFIAVAALRVQSQLLGNPIATLGRLIAPHYR